MDSIEYEKKVPEWASHANIYEVNVRQYTPEGTFKAFQQHLPRLKQMGVEILWLMPINPIGEKNRKGSLGSYYSVKNYTAVNPEFGTEADLKNLVAEAHKQGMQVIIDWVANHTAYTFGKTTCIDGLISFVIIHHYHYPFFVVVTKKNG